MTGRMRITPAISYANAESCPDPPAWRWHVAAWSGNTHGKRGASRGLRIHHPAVRALRHTEGAAALSDPCRDHQPDPWRYRFEYGTDRRQPDPAAAVDLRDCLAVSLRGAGDPGRGPSARRTHAGGARSALVDPGSRDGVVGVCNSRPGLEAGGADSDRADDAQHGVHSFVACELRAAARRAVRGQVEGGVLGQRRAVRAALGIRLPADGRSALRLGNAPARGLLPGWRLHRRGRGAAV